MRGTGFLAAAFFLSALGIQAQYQKPTVNKTQELIGLRNCFISSDTVQNRALLIKELKKQYPQVQVVDWAADADFFLETRELDDGHIEPFDETDYKTTELVAYVKRNGQKVVVWTEWESNDDTIRTNENNLVRHLVRAIAKSARTR